MSAAQHYPEPTVGALIFDSEGRLFLTKSHKWAGNAEKAIRAYLAGQSAG